MIYFEITLIEGAVKDLIFLVNVASSLYYIFKTNLAIHFEKTSQICFEHSVPTQDRYYNIRYLYDVTQGSEKLKTMGKLCASSIFGVTIVHFGLFFDFKLPIIN